MGGRGKNWRVASESHRERKCIALILVTSIYINLTKTSFAIYKYLFNPLMSQTQLLSKKSSLQQKHSLNSTSSKQPRQHMSNKHKGIIKNDKNVEMSKSSRQNFLKG